MSVALINEVLRDFERYSGDGKPNAPVGHPLPVGDPRSGIHNPAKYRLRELLLSILQTMGDPAALQDILNQLGNKADISELRDGRVYSMPGGNDPSGLDIPDWADTLLLQNNAGGTYSLWRPTAAPDPAVETANLKIDANGVWWTKQVSGDFGEVIDSLLKAIAAEASLRADGDALQDAGRWPGDDAVHAMAQNGAALVTMPDGTTRGTFTADDVLPGAEYSMLRNDEAADMRSLIPSDFPGDHGQVISMGENGVAAAWDEQGRLRGIHIIEIPSWPGDWIMPLVIDTRGVVVEGYDTRDGSDYVIGIAISGWPGDFIIPLEMDLTGRIARGYDIRDGSEYPEGSGGGGASVEFVDPGIVGDAWGAVADSNGVIKFTSRMWQGEVIGFEQRDGKVLADTGTIATGILAIGGGDIGVARSQRDYPWHVLDEALAYQGPGNGADAAAAAYLEVEGAAFRARPTVIPLAEVIGSTVAADVLPGASRRVQLINRLSSGVAALATWDKRLVVDRIKLDLLDGAPGTAELTADSHYAAIGNGLRMEAAKATGQAMLPLLIVNQGFGTRGNGNSPVILAEGRLDWNHFALGFVIPTPLYPFDLEPGTQATLTQESALIVSELEALAVAEIVSGEEWFCPSLEEAALGYVPLATYDLASFTDNAEWDLSAGAVTYVGAVATVSNNQGINISPVPEGNFRISADIQRLEGTTGRARVQIRWLSSENPDTVISTTSGEYITLSDTSVHVFINVGSPPEGAEFYDLMLTVDGANTDGQVQFSNITIDGAKITARFATMTDLIIHDPANHGFTVSGESATAVTITNVSVSGSFATITLDGIPDGTPVLSYAFGQFGTPPDAKPINRGSLTDSWSAQSRAVPSETLYRHARSGRAAIQ